MDISQCVVSQSKGIQYHSAPMEKKNMRVTVTVFTALFFILRFAQARLSYLA